jgi:epoxide hydrolase 4
MKTPSLDPVRPHATHAPDGLGWRALDRPDVVLQVRVAGDGAPWVLLHGFPDDGALWQPVLQSMRAHGECVGTFWMPDLRGCGRSLPEGKGAALDCGTEALMADVEALVDAAGGGASVVLVGHDWGGMLAWCHAARRPDRVRALVVCNAPHPVRFAERLRNDPAQRAVSGYALRLGAPGAAQALAADDHAALRAVLAADGHPPPEAEVDRLAAVWSRALPTMLAWYARLDLAAAISPAGLPALPAIDGAGRIDVPTLVLWGERDRSFVPDVLDGLGDLVPRLRVKRIPDGGHWLPRSHANEVADAMRDFVAGLT